MNDQEIAKIIFELIQSVSNNNIEKVISEWKFEIVSVLQTGHVIGISKKIQPNISIENIEFWLFEYSKIRIKFHFSAPPNVGNYIHVYL